MNKDELKTEWLEIEETLKSNDCLVFPAIPEHSDENVVAWPEDKSVSGFLSLAKSLGIRLLYAQKELFEQNDLDVLESDLQDEEGNVSPEGTEFLASAKKNLDYISFIWVEWIYENVVHRYFKEAEWHSQLEEEFADLTEEPEEDETTRHEAEAIARQEQIAQWQAMQQKRQQITEEYAQKLAHSEDYAKARGYDGQIYICKRMFLDLNADGLEKTEKPTAWNVVNRAKVIYEMEILPNLEKSMARKARQLIAAGKSKIATSAELGIGEKKLARLLAQYNEEE